MNNPAVRHWGKLKRQRNLEAKALRTDPQYRMKVRENKKRRADQRKYRKQLDEAGDYEHLDDWLIGDTDG